MALVGRIARSAAVADGAARAGTATARRGCAGRVVGEAGRHARTAGETAAAGQAPDGGRGRLIVLVALAIVAFVSVAPPAHSAPRVVPGWPVVAPTGTVLPGPGGGPLVVGGALARFKQPGVAAVAFRRDGVRRWGRVRDIGCGNCDVSDQPLVRQADGTYGPLGLPGALWAVGRSGAIVPACAGSVLPDGTCIGYRSEYAFPETPRPGVLSSRDGVVDWSFEEPTYRWEPVDRARPVTLRDASGVVYSAYGQGFPPGSDGAEGAPAPGRLVALAEVDGVLRWRRLGSVFPLVALEAGVVVETEGALTAIGADGVDRWSVPSPGGRVTPSSTLFSARQRAVYIGGADRVTALDARTGATRWRTSATEVTSLLAVTRTGVLVAAERGRRTEIRAHSAAGRMQWRLRTPFPVAGAAELPDGTVAFSSGGLLTRVDPARRADRVRRARISLDRSRVRVFCAAEGCALRPHQGALLRIALPRAANLRIRVVTPKGTPYPAGVRPRDPIRAPAGRSVARVLLAERATRRDGARAPIRSGRAIVEVRWRDRGRGMVRRLPVSIVGVPGVPPPSPLP